MSKKPEEAVNLMSALKQSLAERIIASPLATCDWEQDQDGYWQSGCGQEFEFLTVSGPADNAFAYCPFCGKPLTEQPFVEEEVEDE